MCGSRYAYLVSHIYFYLGVTLQNVHWASLVIEEEQHKLRFFSSVWIQIFESAYEAIRIFIILLINNKNGRIEDLECYYTNFNDFLEHSKTIAIY